ncbi:MAG: hypothetical protein ACI4TS_05830 [Bacteroidaceae bacterium]
MKKIFSFLLTLICVGVLMAGTGKDDNDGLSARAMRKYKALYLEAMCRKEAGDKVAAYRLLQRAIRLNPRGGEAYFELATFIEKNREYFSYDLRFDLLDYYEKAHELCPDNADYTLELGRSYLITGDSNCVKIIRPLLKNQEKRDQAFTLLCDYYTKEKDFDKLCGVLEQWRPIKDDDMFIWDVKFRVAESMLLYERMLEMADTVISLYPEKKYQFLLCYKLEACLDVNGREEFTILADSIEKHIDPDFAPAYLDWIKYKCGIVSNDDDMCIKALTRIVLNPLSDMRLTAFETLLKKTGISKTRDLVDTLAINLLPLEDNNIELYNKLYATMDHVQSPDSLKAQILNRILILNPSDDRSRISLIIDASKNEDVDKLSQLCVDGLKENPKNSVFYLFLAGSKMMKKDTESALDLYEEGKRYITSDNTMDYISQYYSSYADALHEIGRKEEAYAMYDSALIYNNVNTMCLNNYAYFLSLDNKNLDKAWEMSAKTIEISPDEPTFLDTYAWIVFLQKDYAEARKYIDLTINNTEDIDTPENITILDHAGDIYFHNGFREEAVNFWKRAAKLDGATPLMKKKASLQRYIKE